MKNSLKALIIVPLMSVFDWVYMVAQCRVLTMVALMLFRIYIKTEVRMSRTRVPIVLHK